MIKTCEGSFSLKEIEVKNSCWENMNAGRTRLRARMGVKKKPNEIP